MKFTRERLIKIIKEEAQRLEMTANMPKCEPEDAEKEPTNMQKQLEWLEKSMERIREFVEKTGAESIDDPDLAKMLHDSAFLLDRVADVLGFSTLVGQHMGQQEPAKEDE